MIEKIKDILSKNPATVAAAVVAIGLVVVVVGCEQTTRSPLTGEQVTRAELSYEVAEAKGDIERRAKILSAELDALEAEAEALEASAGVAVDEIEAKEGRIAEALNAVEAVVVTVAGQYAPLATLGFGLLALGLGVDNRRKDGVIKGQKQIADRTVSKAIVPGGDA